MSRFFRDYVYIPLGGNRRGAAWQAVFVGSVFLLTGLWHGAGWTFVAWGGTHGLLVLTNHLWSRFVPLRVPTLIAWPTTVLAAVCLWVIFRAPDWAVAVKVLDAMAIPEIEGNRAFPDQLIYGPAWLMTAVLWMVALFLPNSRAMVRRLRRSRLSSQPHQRPQPAFWVPVAATAAMLYLAMASIGSTQSKFIYFNF